MTVGPTEDFPVPPSVMPAVLVHAVGDLDTLSAPVLRTNVEEVAASTGAALIVIDVSAVGFLDSAGLSSLLGVHRNLPRNQRIALANVPARMQRMLRVAAISSLFEIHQQGEPWPWPDVLPQNKGIDRD